MDKINCRQLFMEFVKRYELLEELASCADEDNDDDDNEDCG